MSNTTTNAALLEDLVTGRDREVFHAEPISLYGCSLEVLEALDLATERGDWAIQGYFLAVRNLLAKGGWPHSTPTPWVIGLRAFAYRRRYGAY